MKEYIDICYSNIPPADFLKKIKKTSHPQGRLASMNGNERRNNTRSFWGLEFAALNYETTLATLTSHLDWQKKSKQMMHFINSVIGLGLHKFETKLSSEQNISIRHQNL